MFRTVLNLLFRNIGYIFLPGREKLKLMGLCPSGWHNDSLCCFHYHCEYPSICDGDGVSTWNSCWGSLSPMWPGSLGQQQKLVWLPQKFTNTDSAANVSSADLFLDNLHSWDAKGITLLQKRQKVLKLGIINWKSASAAPEEIDQLKACQFCYWILFQLACLDWSSMSEGKVSWIVTVVRMKRR